MVDSSEEHIQEIKLISETFIRPKQEEDESSNSNPTYHLGPMDLFMLPVHPMQKGLLFSSKPAIVAPFLAKLKNSLCLSLLHFHPLAGRFVTRQFPDDRNSCVYVDCAKGPGARLLHASVDLTVSDIVSSVDVHPIVRSFFDLGEKAINHDGHSNPLLSIQVTELLDGVFIGFNMNHSVGDGTSLWNFISSLSEIFNNNNDSPLSKRPLYGPILQDGPAPVLKLPYFESNEFISEFELGPLRERIFHFSSTSMAKLKKNAHKAHEAHQISSFKALCAFLWRAITKARELRPNDMTTCTVVVNIRPRINPIISEAHFGNMILFAPISCTVGELLGNELGWVGSLVNRGVTAYGNEEIRELVSSNVKAPCVAQTDPGTMSLMGNNLLIGGSTRFDMYGPEFGLGRAVAVLAGYGNKHDGKVIANPGREGPGTVDLEVCLEPIVMDALELDDEFMSFVN